MTQKATVTSGTLFSMTCAAVLGAAGAVIVVMGVDARQDHLSAT
jgi:hypothetical protein